MLTLGTCRPVRFLLLLAASLLVWLGSSASALADCEHFTPFGQPVHWSLAGDVGVTTASEWTVICHAGQVVAFNSAHNVSDWVAFRLRRDDLLAGDVQRKDAFRSDPEVPDGHRVVKADYTGTGYDRGHLAPAAAMKWSPEAMSQSFFMSNMAPQVGTGFNRHIWKSLEQRMRSVQRLAHCARNRCEGVCVPSQRHGVADDVLEARGLERADECCRHRALAGDVEPMGWPEGFEAPLKVVGVALRDRSSHRIGLFSVQGEPDRLGHGPGPLDAFGVVVRDLRDPAACRERFLQGPLSVQQCDRGHPHGGSIPEAPVRRWIGTCDPFPEESSVASPGVAPAPALECRVRFAVVQEDVGDGGGAHGVVGVPAVPVEQLEVLRAAAAALESRPCDVADDCSPHRVFPPCIYAFCRSVSQIRSWG